ncbi:unnamed protein product [Caenorhabditis brenneri]
MATTIEKIEDYKKKGEFIYLVISRSPNLAIGVGVVVGIAVYVIWNRKSKKLEKLVTLEDIQLKLKENGEELRRIAARDEELSQAEFEKLMEKKQSEFEAQLLEDEKACKNYEEELKKKMEVERKYEENIKHLEENLPFIGQDEPSISSQISQMNDMETDDTSSESSGPDDNED